MCVHARPNAVLESRSPRAAARSATPQRNLGRLSHLKAPRCSQAAPLSCSPPLPARRNRSRAATKEHRQERRTFGWPGALLGKVGSARTKIPRGPLGARSHGETMQRDKPVLFHLSTKICETNWFTPGYVGEEQAHDNPGVSAVGFFPRRGPSGWTPLSGTRGAHAAALHQASGAVLGFAMALAASARMFALKYSTVKQPVGR